MLHCLLSAVPGVDLSKVDLSKIVLAIGGLGTAAYGVVDATKSFWGGVSNRGFGDIKKIVSKLIPASSQRIDATSAVALRSALDTLYANWINGMALTDQKSIAKSLIKLNLRTDTAPDLAKATGLDASILGNVATKIGPPVQLDANGNPVALGPVESDVFGRFDLAVSALLDQGYQRADQRYRNSAKLAAVFVSIGLAVVGSYYVYGDTKHFGLAFVAGLLATPLAPVAKDLSSAIQAGAKVAQVLKR
ncbi:MAG: hypothetical protein ABSH13_07955 [Candidatus Acidiferrum sp.]|jgi:hypothetical protein